MDKIIEKFANLFAKLHIVGDKTHNGFISNGLIILVCTDM